MLKANKKITIYLHPTNKDKVWVANIKKTFMKEGERFQQDIHTHKLKIN